MNKTKFTPGPWTLDDRTTSALAVNDTDGMIFINAHGPVARLSAMHYGISETRANAKLIAAAPDMFDAIKKALEIKQLWFPAGNFSVEHEGEAQALQSMFNALEAAINKATS